MKMSRVLKKIEIAIAKLVDLQDAGYGCDRISRLLENLNSLHSEMLNNTSPVGRPGRK